MAWRAASAALVLVAAGCAPAARAPAALPEAKPSRIVSLDYCADQFVLKLADRSQIAALSPDSRKAFSHLAREAQGLPQVRSRAEDVISLRPDLIVRSYGGGPGAEAFFQRAGLRVAQLEYAEGYEGIRSNIRSMAAAVGHSARGEALVGEFDSRLAGVRRPDSARSALYMTAGGVTAGEGTMIDTMMKSAGLSNFNTRQGWNPLPLERLAREWPDLVIAASFGQEAAGGWSSARHPVARAVADGPATLSLDGALTACGGWFVVEAVDAMAARARGAP